jgi:predicted DNA-binding protein (MmcQ/YjbR family)
MDVLEFRQYCLSLPMVEETTPFDETTLVYKVGGKMFCYTDMVEFEWIALKCDPDEAIELRERYPNLVTPAYHGNKKHWNGISTRGELTDRFIHDQLRDSYLLVAKGITPKRLRDEVASTIKKSGMFRNELDTGYCDGE